jgi:hypothetical protein
MILRGDRFQQVDLLITKWMVSSGMALLRLGAGPGIGAIVQGGGIVT